jgi:pimeloyl-ACP methyl ester carboxylesterase
VLDEGDGPMVLVGHSSGGLVITEVGEHPFVKHLVFLDGSPVDAGESPAALLAGQIDRRFTVFWRHKDGMTWADPDALTAYLRGEGWLTDDADEFVAGWVPSRHSAQVREITAAAWRTVPSTFVWCTESCMSNQLQALYASRTTHVVKIPGDHFPNWRRPRDVADILARKARDAVSH